MHEHDHDHTNTIEPASPFTPEQIAAVEAMSHAGTSREATIRGLLATVRAKDAEIAVLRAQCQPRPFELAHGVTADVLYGSLEGRVLVARVRFDPGAQLGPETHEEHDEHLMVVSGEIERVGEHEIWRLGARSDLSISAGASHLIRNASAIEHAEAIAVMRRVKAAPSAHASTVTP
jgi:mannose-6-phosphate isomerase-like protein (cupin superfamily)